MVRLNRTRMNFLEEFQKMIDEYNSGAANIEAFFAKLMAFTKKLSEEEKRGIAESTDRRGTGHIRSSDQAGE